jgi:hypothetical protein
MAGDGNPDVVTEKLPAVPTVNVVALADVMVGGVFARTTVNVNDWVAFGVIPLLAVMVIGHA